MRGRPHRRRQAHVAAKRTPIRRVNGALAGHTAVELGIVTVQQVLAAGVGQNPARQVTLGRVAAKVPRERSAQR